MPFSDKLCQQSIGDMKFQQDMCREPVSWLGQVGQVQGPKCRHQEQAGRIKEVY